MTLRAFDRCAICDSWRFWHRWLQPRTDFIEPFPGSHPHRTWLENTAYAVKRAVRRVSALRGRVTA